MCAIIGHSADSGSIQGDASKTPGFELSHDLLQRLLRRYPFGHIFSHDDLGVVLQSSFRRNDHGRSHPSRPEFFCIHIHLSGENIRKDILHLPFYNDLHLYSEKLWSQLVDTTNTLSQALCLRQH
jgi:hypothetical protein